MVGVDRDLYYYRQKQFLIEFHEKLSTRKRLFHLPGVMVGIIDSRCFIKGLCSFKNKSRKLLGRIPPFCFQLSNPLIQFIIFKAIWNWLFLLRPVEDLQSCQNPVGYLKEGSFNLIICEDTTPAAHPVLVNISLA